MTRIRLLLGTSLIFLPHLCHAQPKEVHEAVSVSRLTDADIAQAIALGVRYTDANKLFRREFRKTNRFAVKGWSWAATIELFTDRTMIATAACVASHELRQFSVADVRALPDLGKLKVLLFSSDSGNYHNATRDVHIVLRIGDQTLQPHSKSDAQTSVDYSHRPGVPDDVFASLSFTFDLPDHATVGQLVFIGANNKQHIVTVDFSELH